MNAPTMLPAQPESDMAEFQELWRTINRHKWRVLGIAVAAAILGAVAAYSKEPLYRASISVLIEARLNQPVRVQEVYDPGVGTEDYYGTQYQLLRSRELAGRVVDKLSLTENPDILPPPKPSLIESLAGTEWLQWLPFLPEAPAAAPVPDAPDRRRERAIDALLARAVVSPVPHSQIMVLSVSSHSPALAATIANTWGDLFVESGLESRLGVTEHASRWLNDRLGELKSRLEESEKALQAFRDKNKVINLGGARNLYEEDVSDNAHKLRDAQNKKTELASTYWKIQQAGDDDRKLEEVSALLLDPVVQKASENFLQADQAVKQLQERYGAKHPQMTAAVARRDAAQRAYYEQLRLAANGIKAQYEIAAETERALLEQLQAGKEQIRRLDQQQFQQSSLEREANANRDIYDLFLKRFKETDTTSTYDEMNARVVDRAVPPLRPYSPNVTKWVALWTLGGLLVGTVLAALRHVLSGMIRSPEQIEHATQLPVLCVLPPVPGLGRKISAAALCATQPRAHFSEGVRSIRASLFLSDVDKRMKRIMFTSAVPREGKSSLAAGFAVTMAQMERVLLVEGDLRAPTQKKHFGIPKERPGLVEVLTGQAKLDDAIFRHEATGIDVLPIAEIPPNPAEVVASAAFLKLLATLGERYDRVVFDSPPCQVASDSLLMANRMDVVIFVIHGGATGQRTVQAALKHLRAAKAPLLGLVLNRVDARSAYGYEGRYYTYGYGEH